MGELDRDPTVAMQKHHDMHGVFASRPGGDRAMAALAERQHGVVAYRQLVALGYDRGAIEHRILDGRLYTIHKGVYAVGRRTLTRYGRLMAATLACHGVLSYESAAALWGLRSAGGGKIDVTTLRASRRRPRLRIHHTRCLDPEDVTTVRGIPVTSVTRTLLDLAIILRPDPLTRAVEEADRLGLFDLHALERAIARTPLRRGVKRLRAVLDTYRPPRDTRSELERRFLALVRRAGLPEPQVNVLVAGVLVDFFWPAARLVVELDSRSYHTSPRAFERDRVRDAILQKADCRVLRVTHRRLTYEAGSVREDLLALGAATRPLPA